MGIFFVLSIVFVLCEKRMEGKSTMNAVYITFSKTKPYRKT